MLPDLQGHLIGHWTEGEGHVEGPHVIPSADAGPRVPGHVGLQGGPGRVVGRVDPSQGEDVEVIIRDLEGDVGFVEAHGQEEGSVELGLMAHFGQESGNMVCLKVDSTSGIYLLLQRH